MGSAVTAWWVMVEVACRILGISTAAVLCAVGVDTLRQGEFHSLAIYLLLSGAGMMVFEVAYFLDALLQMCLPFPPGWRVFVLWGKMARLGGFQKFLYYSMMSVVCFLHPVLVWHAVIPGNTTLPGIMLLVTAFFNFILSKNTQTVSPKDLEDNVGITSVCVSERGGTEHTFSFLHMPMGRRGAGLAFVPRESGLGVGERGESSRAMLEVEMEQPGSELERGRDGGERWKEKERHVHFQNSATEETEMEEYHDFEPETTSDTAPMITN
ncbi:transmembrane protein 72 isoform X1 [Coregonus clupeaformis]|uniref:transmembrane protein 72 isoform X1 n=1 Tax=Coregonus clupeaformis TaxID=59861 RepID=UPI001BDFBF4F|nr:transmembrane protein 72 isoform X1 [Coregonus clupeaformis]